MFDTLSEKFDSAFKHLRGKAKISDENIDSALKEVRLALLEADVNFKVVKEFIASVREKSLGIKVITGVTPDQHFIKIVQDELTSVMGVEAKEVDLDRSTLLPILICGLNGQGKTTFSGKLSLFLTKKRNKKVLLVPCDTFRPAAKDQLITHAKAQNVDYFDSDLTQTPAQIAVAASAYAKENGYDVAIFDTAGRLHVDDTLMTELKDARVAIDNLKPEVLMVADAMTGQEAVGVAKSFNEAVGLTGIVLSKMDSDARGGAALSIRHVTGVPIKFISVGEKMQDLELFHPDRLASRILDMGDVITLVEKAEEVIEEKDAENMMKNLQKGKFTVKDFMKQMNMMSKLGSMSGILKMLPGMGKMTKQLGDLSVADTEMKKMKIIISSMTEKEREDYKIMKDSHVSRIARGSGTTVGEVQSFLKKFKQMESMMKNMSSMFGGGGMPSIPGMPGGMGGKKLPKGGMDPFGMGAMGGKQKKGGKKGKQWGKGYF